MASKSNPENTAQISKELGIKITLDNKEVAKFGDIVFIAVKPNQVKEVLEEIKDYITSDKLVVSVAAGVKTGFIEDILPKNSKVIRVMPNTPVLVNEGMAGITCFIIYKNSLIFNIFAFPKSVQRCKIRISFVYKSNSRFFARSVFKKFKAVFVVFCLQKRNRQKIIRFFVVRFKFFADF